MFRTEPASFSGKSLLNPEERGIYRNLPPNLYGPSSSLSNRR